MSSLIVLVLYGEVARPLPVLSHRVFYTKDSVMGDPVQADIFRNLLGEMVVLE